MTRFPGSEPPTVSGWYPAWLGNSASPVMGYWNSRDARWFANGLRLGDNVVAVWIGPDPMPERRV